MGEINYAPYLGQSAHWPSERYGGQTLSIHSMNPGHAINSYQKLLKWATPAWDEREARRTPLAMALLRQAVGVGILYEDDQPEAPHVDDFTADPEGLRGGATLEDAFDILERVYEHHPELDKLHPVTRARALVRAMNTHYQRHPRRSTNPS